MFVHKSIYSILADLILLEGLQLFKLFFDCINYCSCSTLNTLDKISKNLASPVEEANTKFNEDDRLVLSIISIHFVLNDKNL